MTFIPTAQAVKTTISGTYLGETIIQTIWTGMNQAITIPILDNINIALETWFKTSVLTQLSGRYTLNSLTSTDQSSQSGPSRVRLVTTGNTGGVAGTPDYPGSVALCITLNTGQRGRSFRGRNYLGGFSTGSIGSDANSILASAAASLAVAYGVNLINALTGMSPAGFPAVVSHFANNAPRVAGVVTPIQSAAVNVFWDSQRRRLRGRGT